MKKFFHFYKAILKINFSQYVAYQFNVLFGIFVSSSLYSILTIATMNLLTEKTQGILGWNREELLLLVGIYNLAIGIFGVFISSNFHNMSDVIVRGMLDNILLKPIDSQLYLSVRETEYGGFFRTLIGLAYILYLIRAYHIQLVLVNILIFILLIAASLVLMYSMFFILHTILIWHPFLDNLSEYMYRIRDLAKYPRQTYQSLGAMTEILMTPIAFLMALPVSALLGKANLADIVVFIGLSAGFFISSRMFWKFALRFYTSASG